MHEGAMTFEFWKEGVPLSEILKRPTLQIVYVVYEERLQFQTDFISSTCSWSVEI